MLAANRFDHIKASTKRWRKGSLASLCDFDTTGEMLNMIEELTAEIDRRNTPTPARTSRPRPVVLDAQGRPTMPPPMAQQFEGERRDQYALDRHMAVMSLDPAQWRTFSLRWGLTPPPGGWDNTEAIMNVMHAVRLSVRSVPYIDKHFSAVNLASRGIKLPPGMRLEGGVLIGHDTDETLPT